MTGDDVLGLLADAVAVVLEVDPATVTRDTRLVEDLGADSLAIVEIVELLEESLTARTGRAVRLEDEDLDDLRTAGDAVDKVLVAVRAGR